MAVIGRLEVDWYPNLHLDGTKCWKLGRAQRRYYHINIACLCKRRPRFHAGHLQDLLRRTEGGPSLMEELITFIKQCFPGIAIEQMADWLRHCYIFLVPFWWIIEISIKETLMAYNNMSSYSLPRVTQSLFCDPPSRLFALLWNIPGPFLDENRSQYYFKPSIESSYFAHELVGVMSVQILPT